MSILMTEHRIETSPRRLSERVRYDVSLLTDHDLYLFNEGTHYRLYDKLGAHLLTHDGVEGTYFAVWAPDAERVSVIGDFNGWNRNSHPLRPRANSGIWQGFIPGVGKGAIYKYHIESRYDGYRVDKADPFALSNEMPPKTASVIWDLDNEWDDQPWMVVRRHANALSAPMSIYEVHLGSWMRVPEEGHRWLTYRELAPKLAALRPKQMGFTHVEFLPVIGASVRRLLGLPDRRATLRPPAASARRRTFMYLVDTLHQHGIGVILDWVPAHFPADEHGLAYFDGTHLYEHADPRKGVHPDWGTLHLQLRPPRGQQLPDQQRPVLAGQVPRRRPARRCRRLDALSRLFAPRGGMDPQPVRRPREPRGHRLPAPA